MLHQLTFFLNGFTGWVGNIDASSSVTIQNTLCFNRETIYIPGSHVRVHTARTGQGSASLKADPGL